MSKDTLHVVPHGERWAVKREGNERPSSTHDTQKEAIDSARELAREGDNVVVHRPDGTIREQFTASGMVGNGNGNSKREDENVKDEKVKTEDVASVGTRVSWSAVIAGAVTALAVLAALGTLGAAIGLTTADELSGRTLAVSSAILSMIFLLVSLFIGGYVTSRLTAGENKLEAITYGVLLWGTMFALLTYTGLGSSIGYGVLARNNTYQPAAGSGSGGFLEQYRQKADLSDEDYQTIRSFEEAQNEAARLADDVSPATWSWLAFLGLLLSLLASVGGAVMGAGPDVFIEQMRTRRLAGPAGAGSRVVVDKS